MSDHSKKRKHEGEVILQEGNSSEILDAINAMAKEIGAIKSGQETMAKDQKQLRCEIRGLAAIVGQINERGLRSQVEKQFGPSFAKSFTIRCLGDLVKWVLKATCQSVEATKIVEETKKLAVHVEQLLLEFFYKIQNGLNAAGGKRDWVAVQEDGQYCLKSIPQIPKKTRKNIEPKWIHEELSNQFLTEVLKRSEKYFLCADSDRLAELAKCNGVGIPLLSIEACGQYLQEIQLDFRGSIILSNNRVIISIGEGKTKDPEPAFKQLEKKLYFMKSACGFILSQTNAVLIGRIFYLDEQSPGNIKTSVSDDISFYVHSL